jgi:hypothetical protein
MSGHTVVGGAEYFNGFQGAAYVFVKPPTGWVNMTQTARLTPSDGKEGFMGDSVSISGETVVAGAPKTGLDGAGDGAYLFVKPKNGWKNKTETAKLTASRGIGFELGFSVSVQGDTVAVGADEKNNGNGAVYVYEKPTSGWRNATETARLTVPPKANGLGFSVSINRGGKDVIAGAPSWLDGSGRGSADLFVKPISGWETTSKFKARLTATDGQNLASDTSPTAIAAGAPNEAIGNNRKQGGAYVFGR